jgi:Uma2 family endonuclease
MATVAETPGPTWKLQRLRRHFGMIPAERIFLVPRPGTAREEDVVHMHDRYGRFCELVDGVLVEKPMGIKESLLAAFLIHQIAKFLDEHDLGLVLAPDGFMRLTPGLVRAPDVSVLLWERLPEGQLPDAAIGPFAPDLAIEILSPSNTRREMKRKRQEYFTHGTRLVWEVDERNQTVDVYTSPSEPRVLSLGETLDGGDVLPGFQLPVDKLFSQRRKPG